MCKELNDGYDYLINVKDTAKERIYNMEAYYHEKEREWLQKESMCELELRSRSIKKT